MDSNGYTNSPDNALDLAQFDDDFAQASVENRDFEEPPDGRYQVVVDRVELTRSRQSNTPMLKWQLRIMGPTCAGRCLFRNNMIGTPENVRWLKYDLATCGVDVSRLKLSELANHLDKLLDVALEVQKRTNGEYTNVYINRRIELPASARGNSEARDSAGTAIPF